jgi:hypothetical protein
MAAVPVNTCAVVIRRDRAGGSADGLTALDYKTVSPAFHPLRTLA